jgi:hypothetical protein
MQHRRRGWPGRVPVPARVQLGQLRLHPGAAGVELEDALDDRDRLEQKAPVRVAVCRVAERCDRARRIPRPTKRLPGALVPVGIGLAIRDLEVELGRLGVLLLLDRLTGLVLDLAQVLELGHHARDGSRSETGMKDRPRSVS